MSAQDSVHIFNAIEDVKEEISLVNEDSLIKTDTINLKLKLSKISWYNSRKKATNINLIENDFSSITLPYNNAFVKFEFTFTNFPVTNNNKFKFKLNSVYSSWRTLEKNNELTFTNLPSGKYILEIVYSTGANNSNLKTLKTPIIVNQIYYKKWWFIIASVCFVASLLFGIRKYELYHINKMEELKLKISRDLHDELGSALTGIAIKSDLLLEKIDLRSKKEVLSEIAEQSRSAVDALSDIVWVIDSSNNNIHNLSERMESILYQFLTPLNITFKLQSLQDKKPILIHQDYRQHVFLIFKEAITNIMKHSNATNVFVSVTKHKNNLKLTIKDNGTKITNEYKTLNGNGIKNMKLRAEKINGEIQFIYNEGFTVELLFNY
tara:strand:+ start:9306 stop:10442 length:1137 start_codon:yes stop_codon:yes gene_type:complete